MTAPPDEASGPRVRAGRIPPPRQDPGTVITCDGTTPPSSTPPRGVNLVGPLTAAMGLGVAVRNTLAVLGAAGEPVAAIDVDLLRNRRPEDDNRSGMIERSARAPYPVNLFHLNVQEFENLRRSRPPWLDLERRTNAIVPFWELPRLPIVPDWAGVLGAMDLVLAPSRFILEAIRRSAPTVRVAHFPQTVFVPGDVSPNRDAFGLPRDHVLFYMSIDVTSDIERKNPAAVIAAFRAAFRPQERVSLVVKLGHTGSRFPWADATDLRTSLAGLPNTVVVDRQLTYTETLSLNAACDVYVSLHRAEGLGLNLMEAMALGRPVIATAWSGNMDFMTPADACLVGHEFVPVRARHHAYRPEAVGPAQAWAEPSVAEATAWMRRLADDSVLRRRIGDAARTAMDVRRAKALEARFLDDLAAVAATVATGRDRRVRRGRWRRLSTPLPTRVWRFASRWARRFLPRTKR